MSVGGDPAEAATGVARLARLADDGRTGALSPWDGTRTLVEKAQRPYQPLRMERC